MQSFHPEGSVRQLSKHKCLHVRQGTLKMITMFTQFF